MITTSERSDQGNRIFRIALVVSLLAHLVFGFIFYEASADVRRVLARAAHPKPEPTDETVTLSTAFRIDRRPKAQARPHAAAAVVRPPQKPQPPKPEERPVAVVVPHPVVVRTPVPQAPSRARHELAKIVPHAKPAPPETTVAKIQTTTPTAPPATAKPEKVVASLERPPAVTRPERPDRPGHAAQLSEAQIAQIQSDLQKSIVKDRAENNPLSNVAKPVKYAATYHRAAIDFAALAGDMRAAQGLCDPTQRWQAGGWDYYYATCTIQEPDGSTARKPMPWPVRWRPNDDPWTGYSRVPTGPMPLPPPGWHPTAAIDPDFVGYLKKNGYPI